MRVALSSTPIDSSSGKPERLIIGCMCLGECGREAIDQNGSENAEQSDQRERWSPWHPHQQHCSQRGKRHLSDVTGEIVGAEC
jgi:hypothetical protein